MMSLAPNIIGSRVYRHPIDIDGRSTTGTGSSCKKAADKVLGGAVGFLTGPILCIPGAAVGAVGLPYVVSRGLIKIACDACDKVINTDSKAVKFQQALVAGFAIGSLPIAGSLAVPLGVYLGFLSALSLGCSFMAPIGYQRGFIYSAKCLQKTVNEQTNHMKDRVGGKIKITINGISGHVADVSVYQHCTVGELKEAIYKSAFIPKIQQRIIFEDTNLQDFQIIPQNIDSFSLVRIDVDRANRLEEIKSRTIGYRNRHNHDFHCNESALIEDWLEVITSELEAETKETYWPGYSGLDKVSLVWDLIEIIKDINNEDPFLKDENKISNLIDLLKQMLIFNSDNTIHEKHDQLQGNSCSALALILEKSTEAIRIGHLDGVLETMNALVNSPAYRGDKPYKDMISQAITKIKRD